MKTLLLLSLLWPALVQAQDPTAGTRQPASLERPVPAKEIRDARFDTHDCTLTFRVSSDYYYYRLNLRDGATANYAVLNELRAADQVILRLDPTPPAPGEVGRRVDSFVFQYERLHP